MSESVRVLEIALRAVVLLGISFLGWLIYLLVFAKTPVQQKMALKALAIIVLIVFAIFLLTMGIVYLF